jgi:GAF domain-containing protein
VTEISAELQGVLDHIVASASASVVLTIRSSGSLTATNSLTRHISVHSGSPAASHRISNVMTRLPSAPCMRDRSFRSKTWRRLNGGPATRDIGLQALVRRSLLPCRADVAIGVLIIRRREVRAFTDDQVALVESFAEMAALAIENARLKDEAEALKDEAESRSAELREALEHQTATAEVLGIVSRSPTDVQPVLDAICESAARVCGINDVHLRIIEGDQAIARSHFGNIGVVDAAVSAEQGAYRWIAEHGTLHIHDAREQDQFPELRRRADNFQTPVRTFLYVPLWQQRLVGALVARRDDVRPFTDSQIKLLETFADQAVIAIENVRLFDELQQKTREQAETLLEQEATNHILEIISQSPTDVQPVFDAICESAARVLGVDDIVLRIVEGDLSVLRAQFGSLPPPRATTALDQPNAIQMRHGNTIYVPDRCGSSAPR